MSNKIFNILSVLSIAILLIYFLGIIPALPDRIPMNINGSGHITSWGSKNILWLFSLIPIAIFATYKIYEYFADRLDTERTNEGDERIILLLIIVQFVYIAILYTEMIRNMDYDKVNSDFFLRGIMFGFGVLMIGMGNYLPRIHKNKTMGIKIPWTLKNEEVWDKTHILAGKTSVIAGIFIIAITTFNVEHYLIYSVVSMILGIAVIPSIYAYKLYHKIVK